MANTLLFNPFIQVVDANGKPYAGAKLYTYQAGTTTPLASYANSNLTTPHTNPVIADANGTFPAIYLQKQSYKLRLETSANVLIDETDNVDSTESAVEQYVNSLLQTTLTEIIQDLYAGQDYRLTNNGTVFQQLFSAKSDATSSDIGLSASGNNLDVNFSYVNTNSQNIRNAYLRAVSTSKSAGSESATVELGLRSGNFFHIAPTESILAGNTTSTLTLRSATAIDTAGREIGAINFQEPEGTGDGTLAIEAAIKSFRGDTDSFNSSGALAFFTKPFAGTLTERVRVTPAGNVGIGTNTPSARLDVANVGLAANTIQSILSRNPADLAFALSAKSGANSTVTSISSSLSLDYIGAGTAAAIHFWRGGGTTDGALSFDTNGVQRTFIDLNGNVFFPSVGTTASAANAVLNNGSSPANQLLRSTSSIKYKTEVTDLTETDAYKALALRPITYKSLAEADNQTKTHFGLIAEEVAEIEPRLVHYANGQPDGVQYERLCVLLLKVVKDLKSEVDALKAQVQGG